MTQVDFYVLERGESGARDTFACRLTEKVWRKGHRVYLHSADRQSAEQLGRLLWGFRPDAFVPHRLCGEEAPPAAVLIGWDGAPASERPDDVLINLAAEVPDFFGQFQRISEIVTGEPSVRQATRRHWRIYQENGCRLKKHDIPG